MKPLLEQAPVVACYRGAMLYSANFIRPSDGRFSTEKGGY